MAQRRLDDRLEILYCDPKLSFRKIADPSCSALGIKPGLPALTAKQGLSTPGRRLWLLGSPTLRNQTKAGPVP